MDQTAIAFGVFACNLLDKLEAYSIASGVGCKQYPGPMAFGYGIIGGLVLFGLYIAGQTVSGLTQSSKSRDGDR
jgi:hypothetical protein